MSETRQPLHLKKKVAGAPAPSGNSDEKASPHLGARTLGLKRAGGGGGPSELLRSAVSNSARSGLSSRASYAPLDRMNSPSPNPSSMSPSPSPLSPYSPANPASPGLCDLPTLLPASVAQIQPFNAPQAAPDQSNSQLYVSMNQHEAVSVQPVSAASGALSALAALTSDSGPRRPVTRPDAIDSDDKEKEGADSQKAGGEDLVSKVDLYPSPSPQPSREEVLRQEVLASSGRVRDLVLHLDISRAASAVSVLELVKNNLNQCVWVLEQEQEQDEPAPRGLPVPFSALGDAARRSSSKHLDIVKQLQAVEASEVRANAHLIEEQPVTDKAPFLKSLSRQDLNQHTVTRDYDSPRLGARSIKDSPLVARRRPDAPAPVGGPTTSSRAMHQKRVDPAVSAATAAAAALREEEAVEQKLPPQRDVLSERPPNPLRSPHQHSIDSDTDNDSDEESQHAETITVHARTPVPGPRAAQSDLLPLRRAEIEAANSLAAANSTTARNAARMSRIFNASASLLDNEKSSVNAEAAAAEGLDRSALPKINAVGSGVTEDYNSPDISSRRLRSRQLNREREAMAARDSKPSARAAAAAGGPTSSRAVTSHSSVPQPAAQPQAPAQAQPELVNLRGSVEGLGLDRDAVVLSVKESPFLSMDRLRDRLLREGDLEYAAKKMRKPETDSVVASAAVPAPVASSGLAVAVRRPSERVDIGVTDSPPSSPKEFAALRLRSFAKEDLELQDQQAAKAREETPRPTFLRRIDLGQEEAGASPVIADPVAEKDRLQIIELLDRISKLTSSLSHLTPQSLEQVRVLLQLSLQKVETVSVSATN